MANHERKPPVVGFDALDYELLNVHNGLGLEVTELFSRVWVSGVTWPDLAMFQ